MIVEVHGNKCTVKRDDGHIVENVHAENLLFLPEATRDLENRKEPPTFDDEDIDLHRSPGEMVEDDGTAVAERTPPDAKPGKLDRIAVGTYVAYSSTAPNKHDTFKKLCELGRALNVSRSESSVVVHKHK